MSFVASHWAIRQVGISTTAKLVLMVLADYHNTENGGCFPSKASLAKICCCTERTVASATQELAEAGLISIVSRHDNDGRQTSNQYALHIEGEGGENIAWRGVKETAPLEPITNNHSDTTYRADDPLDEQKIFWDEAVMMAVALKIPPKSQKSIIGKMLKMAGDPKIVTAALEDALSKEVEDPVPWLLAAMRTKNSSYSAKKKEKINDAFAELEAAHERRIAEWAAEGRYGLTTDDTGVGGKTDHGKLQPKPFEGPAGFHAKRRNGFTTVQPAGADDASRSGGWDFD